MNSFFTHNPFLVAKFALYEEPNYNDYRKEEEEAT